MILGQGERRTVMSMPLAGMDDVFGDLGSKGVQVGEFAFLAQFVEEGDAQATAIAFAVPVEQVDLEPWQESAHRRAQADVGHRGQRRGGKPCDAADINARRGEPSG